jgi:GTP-binding protein
MLKIRSVELRATAGSARDYPRERLPGITLVGRSNVGKSSLINCLIGRKNLARTSSAPGKTRTVNFYCVNRSFYLIDLPGYGYAKGPKSERAVLARRIEELLQSDWDLRAVLQLIDCRHPPTALDRNVAEYLRSGDLPILWIAVKSDKLSTSRLQRQLGIIRSGLELSGELPLIPFSSVKGVGKREVWRWLIPHLGRAAR